MMHPQSAPGSKPAPTNLGQAEPRGFSFLRHVSPTLTAVLVDAAFFLKRAQIIYGRHSAQEVARQLHKIALGHLNDDGGHRVSRLYRIFVYDAPPALWKGHLPVSGQAVDFSKSNESKWRLEFHESLKCLRKVALRLGEVPTTHTHWQLKPDVSKALISGKREWGSVDDADFHLSLRQKGVDMRIGLDIASLAFKQQVNQIVLISGDSDFVPAAKLARREGIDFILDPMWATIRPDLYEHIDGLNSVCPKPGQNANNNNQKGGR